MHTNWAINRYAGICEECRKRVEPGDGFAAKSQTKGIWHVIHKTCQLAKHRRPQSEAATKHIDRMMTDLNRQADELAEDERDEARTPRSHPGQSP